MFCHKFFQVSETWKVAWYNFRSTPFLSFFGIAFISFPVGLDIFIYGNRISTGSLWFLDCYGLHVYLFSKNVFAYMMIHSYKKLLLFKSMLTLVCRINVGLRLLIWRIFLHGHMLIWVATFINSDPRETGNFFDSCVIKLCHIFSMILVFPSIFHIKLLQICCTADIFCEKLLHGYDY